jgi:hypothetical protein
VEKFVVGGGGGGEKWKEKNEIYIQKTLFHVLAKLPEN